MEHKAKQIKDRDIIKEAKVRKNNYAGGFIDRFGKENEICEDCLFASAENLAEKED